jgi:Protein of unknown function (DUF2938)
MTAETILLVLWGTLAGVAATVTMDVLASAFRKLGLIVGAKGQWVGRWYLGMAQGRFTCPDIAAAPEQPGEARAAMVGHYAIGIVLGVVYVFIAKWLGFSPGGFAAALAYGLATCVFPYFMMFPAMGFGVFGLKGPPELRMFITSLLNHMFYGFGLWWSAKVLGLG